MAAKIISEFKGLDASGTGAVSRDELASALKRVQPEFGDAEIDTLLYPWGDGMVKYEDFVWWLFGDSAQLARLKAAAGKTFKIALFSCAPYDKEWFEKMNKELGTNFQILYFSEMMSLENVKLATGCDAVCMFVNDHAGTEIVQALGKIGVKMIALRCAGFDRVDLEAAEACGITVARVPAYSPYAVAEHAVTLMLSLNRRIASAYRNTRMGNFTLNGLIGTDMVGKKVGIIGTGLIGSITARILKKGFECDVVAYDVFENPKVKNPEPEGLGIPYAPLDEVLKTCDFISIHAPLLPATKHMINAEKVAIMKKGIMIVNTSRGPLIDTAALITGLKDGTIAGAGLDVVEGEGPYFFKNCSLQCIDDNNLTSLLRMPNVIITAHQAFFTAEALRTIADTTLKNVKGVQDGSGPPKQNGTLETLCKPPASSPGGSRPPPKAPTQADRDARMSMMQALPAPAPALNDTDFPQLENTGSRPYKVSFFSTAPYDKEWFEKVGAEFNANINFEFHESRLSTDTVELAHQAEAVCIFVNDECGTEVVKALNKQGVKMIALRCAGFNNVDLETAESLGMLVARVPAYSPHAVAEHAVSLATAVNRRIPQAIDATKRCNFELNGLLGFDMVGKKVGIIGTGLIGSISARIFKNGFGCDVICSDVYENPKIKDDPPNGLGCKYVSQDELFRTSDIVCLHAPLLRETQHTINMDAIRKMKKGVIIINTSRGGLIDTKALITGLREGIVGGAGLDVVENEDAYFFTDWSNKVVMEDDIVALTSFNNVVLTAHQAFFTMEAMKTICHTTLSNLNAARNGVTPPQQRGKYDTVVKPKK
mmetsp:Transcript_20047/g.46682  ORF Transcript_20047/g.46682 Transcript_20047/m.46682 type:complete len:824 (+) Transcript_20047:86-2557(+)|eukprot:CAMPEP_0178440690 /NCGR_PEP_ID=MMETSP0689_2-20121128/36938_1 /TAXON_ID=160604 /ORGANISM="Amphidinium massartii, Strain CS-259" /LENGTH=823 /DNA_ID=CAMNT_0020063531 /DNA_START=37 /DNA_END=2508 /DNA_ORIENTATION=+